jgi:hypothetical protein
MYIIIHRHGEEEKFIGTFQDKDFVNEVIERYKQFEGFNKYKDGFIVLEPPYRGKDILQKREVVYIVVSYEWDYSIWDDGDEVDVRYHIIFDNEKSAQKYLDSMKKEENRDYEIQEVILDACSWDGGFYIAD